MSSLFEIPSQPSAARLRLEPSEENEAAYDPEPAPLNAKRSAPIWRAAGLSLGALALVSLAAALFHQHRVAGLPLVRVVRVARGHIAQSIPAVTAGRVAPARELTLRSEAAGRIARVLVEPGDTVIAGDPLFVLEAEDLERAVRSAESGYRVAQASAAEASLRARLARLEAKRTHDLVSSGSLARVEAEQKNYEADVLAQAAAAASARVAGQRAELDGAERAKDRGVIKAPISGLVTSIAVLAGESIALFAPLVTLADVSNLHVSSQVDESDASNIELAMPVELRFEGDDGPAVRSTITKLEPRVSDSAQGSRVLGFEVALPDTRKWRLGVSADVDIVTAEHEAALLVPANAVVTNGQEHQVYVFADGRVAPRRVEPGLVDFAHVEIVRGLNAGEIVVENPASAGLSGAAEVRLEPARAAGS